MKLGDYIHLERESFEDLPDEKWVDDLFGRLNSYLENLSVAFQGRISEENLNAETIEVGMVSGQPLVLNFSTLRGGLIGANLRRAGAPVDSFFWRQTGETSAEVTVWFRTGFDAAYQVEVRGEGP